MHMQRMLEMSRVLYTGGNFKQNVWKKSNGNREHYLRLGFGANLFFIKIYYAITACMTNAFTFRKCSLIEKW